MENPMMPPANGSQPASPAELTMIRPTASADVEPVQTTEPARDNAAPAPTPVTVPVPRQTNLAEAAIRDRTARQSRHKIITASFRLKQRVPHPDAGDSSVEDLMIEEKEQREKIAKDIREDSRKHNRFPGWMHSIPVWVLLFDFGLLLYFFAGVTNVDWENPLSPALAIAIALGAMVTLLSYGAFSFTGHRMRSHKNHAGTIHREDLDGVTRAAFVISVVVIAVLAGLMFTRIRAEVLGALGAQALITALVIATAVAVVNAVANSLVIGIHALDGSDQTARLDKLSAAIRGPLAVAHQLHEEAAKQVNE
jgi:hypothetical protein